MADHDDDHDPDSPAAKLEAEILAEGQRKIAQIDACREIIKGTLTGVTHSGVFDPLTVVAAAGYTLTDIASELLVLSAMQKGRMGYEEAKTAILNLFGLLHQNLVERSQQVEAEMLREDHTRKIRKRDQN